MLKCFLIIISILTLIQSGNSQGCSDAGFCTMGAMKPDQHYNSRINIQLRSIGVSQYIGVTRFRDVIWAYSTDLNINVGNRIVAQIKLPYQATYGVLANTNGIGDISLSLSSPIATIQSFTLQATIGTKIPTGEDDLTSGGRPLAMYYQQGLGTYDVIFGASLVNKQWNFSVGYQQALNRNGSEFKWGPWDGTDLFEDAKKYPSSVGLLRGVDVMNRIERNFRFTNYNFNIGVLTIWRLTKDERTSPKSGEREKVEFSNGPAITLLTGGGYNITAKSAIKLIVGFRLRKRKFNPDGLSREFVNSIEYVYKF